MQFDVNFALALIFRWLHILAAITAVGGTIYARVALVPAMQTLPEGHRKSLQEALRGRWAKAVMLSILFLLVSGAYNFVSVIKQLPDDVKPLYHGLFGFKFLLAFVIFFFASALVGRSAAFERMRQNAKFYLTLNMLLAILLVCVSGVLRTVRDRSLIEKPSVTALQQPQAPIAAPAPTGARE